jgi:dihydrofolate synthase/folylpolyglutamate synthase
MNYQKSLERLFSLHQFGIKLGLENISKLLDHIGNPQKQLKAIHVAGSNGKGSTSSFIASILQEYGFKIGLYTSPHLVKFNERIRINGKEIADDEIIKFLENNKKYIEEKSPTFFEITTAMAFEYFKNQKVDYAVIETGLGGRLDATNTINPLASVITSISLEHSRILGETLEKIAYEKAGIIKKKVPVFIGKLPEEAKSTIMKIALEKGSKVYQVQDEIIEYKSYLKIKENHLTLYKTGLEGKHQLLNAALAIITLKKTLDLQEDKLIIKGVDNIIKNTFLQGRYERYSKEPSVIFDAAHNLEGIESFIEQFKKEYKHYTKTVLIYGAMQDKSTAKMLRLLKPLFKKIFVTSTNYEKAASIKELKEIADKNEIVVEELHEPVKMLQKFLQTKSNDCLVILGSIYLLGDIKNKLQ